MGRGGAGGAAPPSDWWRETPLPREAGDWRRQVPVGGGKWGRERAGEDGEGGHGGRGAPLRGILASLLFVLRSPLMGSPQSGSPAEHSQRCILRCSVRADVLLVPVLWEH